MDKKKVLFVVHQLNIGGVQKAMISLLRVVDYDKYDVTLYVRKDRLDLLPKVDERVNKIIINHDETHYYIKPYSLLMLLRIKIQSILKNKEKEKALREKISEYIANQKIKREKRLYFKGGECYDVAVSYIQGYTAKLVAEGVAAKKKIMFFHGSTDETHSVHEEIFDKLDLIVGVSGGVEEVLKGLYPKYKDKITHITNYVDYEEVIEKSKEYEVKSEKGKAVFCSVGRMTKVKGFDLAVKSAKILKDRGINFIWYFVGDGAERQAVENEIAKFGLEKEIVLVGMKTNPYPYMKACDIYVQPSYEEACALTLIEAKMFLKPIVSTATVGAKCLIDSGINGIVVPITAEGLAEGIFELISNDNLRESIVETLKNTDFNADKIRYSKEIDDLLSR